MTKKWMDLLDQELDQHNTVAASPEIPEVGSQPGGGISTPEPSENGHTLEKGTDKRRQEAQKEEAHP